MVIRSFAGRDKGFTGALQSLYRTFTSAEHVPCKGYIRVIQAYTGAIPGATQGVYKDSYKQRAHLQIGALQVGVAGDEKKLLNRRTLERGSGREGVPTCGPGGFTHHSCSAPGSAKGGVWV